jgi:hypothetical protein
VTSTLTEQPIGPAFDQPGAIDYGWAETGYCLLHASPDHAGAEAPARELAAQHRARLEAAARATRQLPEALEAGRLARDLAEAREQLRHQQRAAEVAQAEVKSSLSLHLDPKPHEETQAEAVRQAELLAGRVGHLERLHTAARRKARQKAEAALRAAWGVALAESMARREEVKQELAEALGPLLVKLLALDMAEAELNSFATPSGLPTYAVALLEADDDHDGETGAVRHSAAAAPADAHTAGALSQARSRRSL